MDSRSRSVLLAFILLVVVRAGESITLEDCLESDSGGCGRDLISRSLKSVFGEESVDFLAGVFGEETGKVVTERGSDSGHPVGVYKDPRYRRNVDTGVAEEVYRRSFGSKKNEAYASAKVEGRGKKKKLKKKLLEYAIAHKILWMIWGVIGYMLVVALAKLALLKGTLALGLGGLIVLKKLLSRHHHPHHVVAEHEIHPHLPVSTGYGHHEPHEEFDHGAVYGGHVHH